MTERELAPACSEGFSPPSPEVLKHLLQEMTNPVQVLGSRNDVCNSSPATLEPILPDDEIYQDILDELNILLKGTEPHVLYIEVGKIGKISALRNEGFQTPPFR